MARYCQTLFRIRGARWGSQSDRVGKKQGSNSFVKV